MNLFKLKHVIIQEYIKNQMFHVELLINYTHTICFNLLKYNILNNIRLYPLIYFLIIYLKNIRNKITTIICICVFYYIR